MRRYRLASAAAADISGIRAYSCDLWGDEKATAYLAELRDRMRWLADKPGSGRERSDLSEGLYSHPQGNHIIYYRVAGDDIEVVRVLHQRMDARRQL